MQNFNQKIEQQLDLLNQFWKKPEYTNEKWESNEPVQEAYYNFIKESGFLKEGEAPRKAKDARQKTSGMRDIGLIDDNRRLTAVGKKLLEIAKSGNFESDNFLLKLPIWKPPGSLVKYKGSSHKIPQAEHFRAL